MNDIDFATSASSLLARCSPTQRERLVKMVQTYGQQPEGAADRSGGSKPLSMDELKRRDPDAGKSFKERFPNADRLTG